MSGYPTSKPALSAAQTILAGAMTPIPVSTKIPFPTRPGKFVRLQRAGGNRPLLVTDAARILVELWATTVAHAEQMSGDAIAALQNAEGTLVDGMFVRGFDNIDGPVDFPDPDITDMERWQFQGDLLVSTSTS